MGSHARQLSLQFSEGELHVEVFLQRYRLRRDREEAEPSTFVSLTTVALLSPV
jgi:hypothetical protein